MIFAENLIGMDGLDVSVELIVTGLTPFGIVRANGFSLISGISTMITNECVSKSKIRYAKLRNWVKVISLL